MRYSIRYTSLRSDPKCWLSNGNRENPLLQVSVPLLFNILNCCPHKVSKSPLTIQLMPSAPNMGPLKTRQANSQSYSLSRPSPAPPHDYPATQHLSEMASHPFSRACRSGRRLVLGWFLARLGVCGRKGGRRRRCPDRWVVS